MLHDCGAAKESGEAVTGDGRSECSVHSAAGASQADEANCLPTNAKTVTTQPHNRNNTNSNSNNDKIFSCMEGKQTRD